MVGNLEKSDYISPNTFLKGGYVSLEVIHMIYSVGHMSHVPYPFTEALHTTIPPRYQVLIGMSFLGFHIGDQSGNSPDTCNKHTIHVSVPLEGNCLDWEFLDLGMKYAAMKEL